MIPNRHDPESVFRLARGFDQPRLVVERDMERARNGQAYDLIPSFPEILLSRVCPFMDVMINFIECNELGGLLTNLPIVDMNITWHTLDMVSYPRQRELLYALDEEAWESI